MLFGIYANFIILSDFIHHTNLSGFFSSPVTKFRLFLQMKYKQNLFIKPKVLILEIILPGVSLKVLGVVSKILYHLRYIIVLHFIQYWRFQITTKMNDHWSSISLGHFMHDDGYPKFISFSIVFPIDANMQVMWIWKYCISLGKY